LIWYGIRNECASIRKVIEKDKRNKKKRRKEKKRKETISTNLYYGSGWRYSKSGKLEFGIMFLSSFCYGQQSSLIIPNMCEKAGNYTYTIEIDIPNFLMKSVTLEKNSFSALANLII